MALPGQPRNQTGAKRNYAQALRPLRYGARLSTEMHARVQAARAERKQEGKTASQEVETKQFLAEAGFYGIASLGFPYGEEVGARGYWQSGDGAGERTGWSQTEPAAAVAGSNAAPARLRRQLPRRTNTDPRSPAAPDPSAHQTPGQPAAPPRPKAATPLGAAPDKRTPHRAHHPPAQDVSEAESVKLRFRASPEVYQLVRKHRAFHGAEPLDKPGGWGADGGGARGAGAGGGDRWYVLPAVDDETATAVIVGLELLSDGRNLLDAARFVRWFEDERFAKLGFLKLEISSPMFVGKSKM